MDKEKNIDQNNEINQNQNGNEDLAAELERLKEELARTRQEAAERRVALKKYADVDPEEYKTLKQKMEEIKQKELEEQGKWEEAKKAIIDNYESKIKEYETKYKDITSKYKKVVINDKIINSAAKFNAINPSQIAVLIRDNVTLNEKGEVEVLNEDGKPIYNEKGELLSVEEYVKNFLTENQYLVKGPIGGTGSKGGQHKPENTPSDPLERLKAGLQKIS